MNHTQSTCQAEGPDTAAPGVTDECATRDGAGQRILFHRAFRVLVAEDDPLLLETVASAIDDFGIFEVETANTTDSVHVALSNNRFHVCLIDFIMAGSKMPTDQVIAAHASRVPIIVVSGMATREQTAMCMQAGAYWVVDKPVVFSSERFRSLLFEALFEAAFIKRCTAGAHDKCEEALRVLRSQRPESVSEWADSMNVHERQLRKICLGLSLPLRDLVRISLLLRHALDLYAAGRAGDCGNGSAGRDERIISRLEDFYFLNRKHIDSFLGISDGKARGYKEKVFVKPAQVGPVSRTAGKYY